MVFKVIILKLELQIVMIIITKEASFVSNPKRVIILLFSTSFLVSLEVCGGIVLLQNFG